MSVLINEEKEGKLVQVTISGKLTKEDYESFTPIVERLINKHGKISMLIEMHEFHGWTAGAVWEDIKFDAKHYRDIEKLALVGESKWEKGMSVFCRPFTSATIRYFNTSKLDDAVKWVSVND